MKGTEHAARSNARWWDMARGREVGEKGKEDEASSASIRRARRTEKLTLNDTIDTPNEGGLEGRESELADDNLPLVDQLNIADVCVSLADIQNKRRLAGLTELGIFLYGRQKEMIDADDQLCGRRAKMEGRAYTIAAKAAMTQTLGSLSVSMTLCFEMGRGDKNKCNKRLISILL